MPNEQLEPINAICIDLSAECRVTNLEEKEFIQEIEVFDVSGVTVVAEC